MLKPTITCRATEHVEQMQRMIRSEGDTCPPPACVHPH
jgi:hypothetical protein